MHFFANVLRIVVIDLALSGDNAVVIGMAAHRLPPKQRRAAILIGGAAAIVLRIVLTIVAALLLLVPGLELAGGLLLIWIAFRLLEHEQESHAGVKVASSMKEAVVTILVADFIMSTDNVLGVAAASEGDVGLLLFGLILSMVILMFMGNLVAGLLNRFWWLAYVGSAVITWTGTLMVVEDPIVTHHLPFVLRLDPHVYAFFITSAILLFAHWFHRVRKPAQPTSKIEP
jgi:YjbE family integral membrane protein